jgi:hypothetical protein
MRARGVIALLAVVSALGASACAAFLSDFAVGESADGGAAESGASQDGTDDGGGNGSDATTHSSNDASDATADTAESTSDGGVADGRSSGLDSNFTSDGSSESGAGGSSDSGSSGDAGCLSWALGGIGVPAGTIVTASTTYQSDVASLAIDGVLATEWWASTWTGWLALQFPSPQAITGIRMAALAGPSMGSTTATEAYTVTLAGSSTTIGSATETVGGTGPYTIEPAIPVTPGTYSGITINVNAGDPNLGVSTSVGINEVSLLTTACP